MAHRSKRKHLAHLHEQEPAKPPAKSPVAKAEAARRGLAKKSPTTKRATPPVEAKPQKKKGGIVRRMAKRVVKRAARKIGSLLPAEK